ncbi:putative glycosyl transferase [uncultured Desulfobacterium sp.]|uniref:Putative glycosyl transferase n=1 Tax=uncultured Desulfobacterium sp. TaxID=201089 RepID=A0A445MUQ0_9BACT|nr:putative glycosyl transferase [uncultured Desulfobacterium sp.]
MDVSIVIVSYNTSSVIDECIESIEKETRCSFEIIVVDNASTDDSCEQIAKRHHNVRLIENRQNVGFARANNQGFEVAQGRYFLMLNPDTVILDNAIDKLIHFMDENPSVGICGPRNVGPNRELQYSCDHFPSIWNTFCSYTNLINRYPNIKLFRRSRMQYWDYAETRDVQKIMGCSLIVRSDLYKHLDGLDNNFFMYFEETDLCFRAIMGGSRVIYVPSAVIMHYGGESSKNQIMNCVINKTVYSYYLSSQYYFYKKNYGYLAMLAIRCLDLCYGLALIAKNTIRRDKVIKTHRIAKGQALCAGAIARHISVAK